MDDICLVFFCSTRKTFVVLLLFCDLLVGSVEACKIKDNYSCRTSSHGEIYGYRRICCR